MQSYFVNTCTCNLLSLTIRCISKTAEERMRLYGIPPPLPPAYGGRPHLPPPPPPYGPPHGKIVPGKGPYGPTKPYGFGGGMWYKIYKYRTRISL